MRLFRFIRAWRAEPELRRKIDLMIGYIGEHELVPEWMRMPGWRAKFNESRIAAAWRKSAKKKAA